MQPRVFSYFVLLTAPRPRLLLLLPGVSLGLPVGSIRQPRLCKQPGAECERQALLLSQPQLVVRSFARLSCLLAATLGPRLGSARACCCFFFFICPQRRFSSRPLSLRQRLALCTLKCVEKSSDCSSAAAGRQHAEQDGTHLVSCFAGAVLSQAQPLPSMQASLRLWQLSASRGLPRRQSA